MREGGKKTILVIEGDQIKETFDKFLEKLMRATK